MCIRDRLLTDYGASVVSIFVKDRDGNERDVILGYANVKSYEKEYCYFGATVGRYANRISDAKINIDGLEYKLEANDNENSLQMCIRDRRKYESIEEK